LGDWSITAGDATVPEDTTGNDVVVSLISGNDVNVVITDAAGAATTLTGTLNPVAMTITIQDGSVGSIQPDGSRGLKLSREFFFSTFKSQVFYYEKTRWRKDIFLSYFCDNKLLLLIIQELVFT
jgi:hypothetical protein